MIKLIAMDVDGTLLTSAGELTPQVREAFREARRAGILLVLGTGRERAECESLLAQLPELDYMVNCTGAAVRRIRDNGLIYSNPVPMETVREIYRRLLPLPCQFELMADGLVYCDAARFPEMTASYPDGRLEYYMETLRTTRTPVDLEKMLRERTEPVTKLQMFFRKPEDSLRAEELLADMGLMVLRSVPENLEINVPDVDKGVGLRALAESLGLGPESVMAIGDNLNDAGMLKYAGYPVVMANANPAVLPLADYMTKSNAESGVAYAIGLLLKGRLEEIRIRKENAE